MGQSEISQPKHDFVSDVTHEVLTDAGEFGKSFFHSAVENPINSIGQIVSFGHLPELHIFEPDPNATGAAKWAQVAGSAAGTLFDCIVLSELAAVGVAAMAGEAVVAGTTAAAATEATTVGLSVAQKLSATAITGFVSGSILTPLQPGESQWHRLSNGVTQAASFLAFDGLSTGLATQFANPTFLNTVARSGISGGFAGLVNANVKSLTEGHGLATPEQMASEATSWATGAAIMGGGTYLLAKGWEALGANSEASQGGKAAEGQEVKVAYQESAGGQQVSRVEMADGTVLTRQGTADRWAASPAGVAADAPKTEWFGDVKVNGEGKLSFIYKYEKTASSVSLEARLPDGSKVALSGADGSLALPGAPVDAISQRLPDAAVQAAKELNLNIPAERLKLGGAVSNGGVTTNYVVDLSAEEAARVRAMAAQNPAIKIVPGEQSIGAPPPVVTHISENQPGVYEYTKPMPDHTATTAVLVPGENGEWQVLTGLRENAPFKGSRALPGGFLDLSGKIVESPSQAATRELLEETGLVASNPQMVGVADAIGRDARNRVIDFQFGTIVPHIDMASLAAKSDLVDPKLINISELLADPSKLAFDHHSALQAAYDQLILTKPPVK